PAPRAPVADYPAQPALPPARGAGARGQGLADPAPVRRADRVRPGHPDGDDHYRADLLDDHRRVYRDPGKIGLASAVTVSQGGLENKQMLALIGHDTQVLAAYPGAQSVTLLPGDNGTFYARAMGTSARPYPFRAVQGRMYRAANEAVAGQGFLDLMHIGVGAWISPTIDGVPVILHIVGRTIEPDNNGDVVDFGLDALNHAGSAPPQLVYH